MEWDVEEPVFITYTTAFVFFPILEPFGKIPANVVTKASIHNLMSSGVLFILIFHIRDFNVGLSVKEKHAKENIWKPWSIVTHT